MRAYPSVTVWLLSMRSTLRASSMIRNRYRKTKVSLNEQRKIVTRFKTAKRRHCYFTKIKSFLLTFTYISS